MKNRYTIGIDFGTLSARAIVLDIHTGEEKGEGVSLYKNGVIDNILNNKIKLKDSYALQNANDYLESMEIAVKEAVKKSGVNKDDIIGIGVDFTSCSVMPILKDGTPLSELEEFRDNPHAYVKLWKHHAAQYCADIFNEVAEKRKEKWLPLYGGKISSEWVYPKIIQIFKEDRHLYDKMDRFIECGDWIIFKLTGTETRSVCNAGYKAQYHHNMDYPSKEFFKEIDEGLENVVDDKLRAKLMPLGSKAGELTEEMAKRLGLNPKIAVATEIIDAHASVCACGIDGPGKMLMIIGTSTCHMLLSKEEKGVKGSCGIVKDGILPGLYAYEAGQSAVGDLFEWCVKNTCPRSYYDKANENGENIHTYLTNLAKQLKVGESGLIMLDWLNGIRSDLMDFDLTGMIVGLTLATKPEEIYRAAIEATAFGTRQIIECFKKENIEIKELYAAGGIAEKNDLAMQIYSDVCNMPLKISYSSQSGALGSAIYAVSAVGKELTGYNDIGEITRKLGKIKDKIYTPIKENVEIYNKLFEKYLRLHDMFGIENNMMKELRDIRNTAKGN